MGRDRIGPKEWRPERWTPSPLLSPEENKRLEFFFRATRRKDATVVKSEIDWLLNVLKQLSQCAPDEFDFPEYLALVNPVACNAFALRYKETLQVQHSASYQGNILGMQLMDWMLSEQVTDASALIRPWVRVDQADPASVLLLRKGRIVMKVDGETAISGPIDEHLMPLDKQQPFRRKPWTTKRTPETLFVACRLTGDMQADQNSVVGIFCPNGSRI